MLHPITQRARTTPDFSRLVWDESGARLGDLRFQLQSFGAAPETPAASDGKHFVLYKTRQTFAEYEALLCGQDTGGSVLELGILDGGSTVLWTELLDPERIVAVDIRREAELDRASAANLAAFIATRPDRVQLHWETDQGDAARLEELVRRECGGVLDFVIDDASHAYELTKRSFETLFRFVRPGGCYAIEDWSWDLTPGIQFFEEWTSQPPLSALVCEIVRLAGHAPSIVRSVRVARNVAVVERGDKPLDAGFSIAGELSGAWSSTLRP